MTLGDPTSPVAAPFRAREFVRAGLLAAAGFVLAAAAVHACLGNPLHLYANLRSEQLLVMATLHGADSSAVFGSSRIHNGFDPVAFDAGFADSPIRLHTANLAIAGGSQVEQRAMALEFLHSLPAPSATAPATGDVSSCLVGLELNAGVNMGDMYIVHPRTINLYDWRGVRLVTQLVEKQVGFKRGAARVAFALGVSGMYYLNVGMVSSSIFRPPADEQLVSELLTSQHDGAELHATEPGNLPSITADIQNAPVARAQPAPTNFMAGNYSLIDELKAASPAKGMNFFYLVSPLLNDLTSYAVYPTEMQTSGGPVPVVDLARPDLYPDLYQVKYWHDHGHLNDQGAKYAGTLAANELKSWYAVHGWPQRCEE